MNKKQIVASLNKIANELDINGLYTEANTVTKIMSRLAIDENDEYNTEDYFPYGDPDEDPDEFLNEEEDEDERDDCCPKCGNCDEREGSTIVMERFSNGEIHYCSKGSCDFNYWSDAEEGVKPPICPICKGRDFLFDDYSNPLAQFECESCSTVFIYGSEA